MSSNRIRHLLVAMIAVFAFGAVMVGAAQAAEPEPTYTKSSKSITAAANVRYTSMWSRLWDYKQKLVIVCERDKGTGTITTKGEDTVAAGLTYTGCTVHEAKLNTTEKQYEEVIEPLKCAVKSKGIAATGEIILPALKSKLVFRPGTNEKELLLRLEPTSGTTFVELVLEGSSCALAGTFAVTGSVLGWVPRVEPGVPTDKEEAVMNDVLFETINLETVLQRFPKYELGGVITEDVLKFGANPAAYESTEQVELEPVAGLRGLFGAAL